MLTFNVILGNLGNLGNLEKKISRLLGIGGPDIPGCTLRAEATFSLC